jgi:sugar lactone lactonase YvrE
MANPAVNADAPRRSFARLSRFARALVTALLAGLTIASFDTQAQDEPSTPLAALEREVAREPDDPVLIYFLAVYRARSDDREGAFEALEQLLDKGDGFLPTAELFPNVSEDRRFAVLRARFERRLPRTSGAAMKVALNDRTLIPEGIAYDADTRRLYVGGIARRGVFWIDAAGRLIPFSRSEDDLDAILGLAIDAKRRRLYAVSTSALTERGRAALRNAVKIYDLDRAILLQSIAVPDARQLNDVSFGSDGTLLLTDSAAGAIYRIDPSTAAVTTIVKPGGAPGANGIASAPDGKHAYVAASRRPLRVNLSTGEVVPLALPPRQNAAAIDGLYWHDGALIGVQNVTTPGRVIRLVLAPDGYRVTDVQTLLSHHHPAILEPTTAAIATDGLYLLTRTYVTRFGDQGVIDRQDTVKPAVILRVPLTTMKRFDAP